MLVLKVHPQPLLRCVSVGTLALPELWTQDSSPNPQVTLRELSVTPQ
jgi:hypothetical protein